MPNDFDRRLALLFGVVEEPPRPAPSRPFQAGPLPTPYIPPQQRHTTHSQTEQLNRMLADAWRTHEGRERVMQVFRERMENIWERHEILRDIDHEIVPDTYYFPDEPEHDPIAINIPHRHIWSMRDAGRFLQGAIDDLMSEVERYLLGRYYTTLTNAVGEEDWADPSDVAGYGGHVLLKSEHLSEFSWLPDYLIRGNIHLVSPDLPWEEPRYTRHLGLVRYKNFRVMQIPQHVVQTTTVVAFASASYHFPLPVYRLRGF